ncbi:MAG TPA: flagella basal body P-ring formation protein FlgA [Acidobacteriaceae bacterium]|nr:flagella basal body P-ring formation protein FlgA [Acidobacteriaceae bacterium]
MRLRAAILFLLSIFGTYSAFAQPASRLDSDCREVGYRVLAQHWDAVLNKAWETRQSCAHPSWPAYLVSINHPSPALPASGPLIRPGLSVTEQRPLLVRAGESVRLWSQDANVHIELTGIAEQSARLGERIQVRITNREESGLTTQEIPGVVRGAGDVEMHR